MLKLYGFPVSNYYNKVKLALLEKEIAFEEVLVKPGSKSPLLEKSPLGKVPFLETEQGVLVESQVLVEYLEDAYPQKSLVPADAFARAKMRELIVFMELHMELHARELYSAAFFGGTVTDETRARIEKLLKRNAAAFKKMVSFGPYLCGEQFTLADCAGLVHLPLIGMASKAVLGEDVLADLPVREYTKKLAERATVQKVNGDKKAYMEALKNQH